MTRKFQISARRFLLFFSIALVLQVFLLFGGLGLLLPGSEKAFRDFLLFDVYAPFINFVGAGGHSGEAAMIWPPFIGALIGVLFYSALCGLIAAFAFRPRSVERPKEKT